MDDYSALTLPDQISRTDKKGTLSDFDNKQSLMLSAFAEESLGAFGGFKVSTKWSF